jgi:hypothetical protein
MPDNGNRTVHDWMMHIDTKLDNQFHADNEAHAKIADKLDSKVSRGEFEEHEQQDTHRFELLDAKIDSLSKKVYMILGGLALLEVLIGWYIAR